MRAAKSIITGLVAISLLALGCLVDFARPGIRIDLDPSSTPLLPSNDPGLAGYRQAVLDFGDDEIFIVAMESEDIFSFDNLSALRRITLAINALPAVRSVESLSNATVIRNDPDEGWLEVGRLIDEIPRDAQGLAKLRRIALEDPLLARNLVSPDGRSAALNVRFVDWSDVALIHSGVNDEIRALLDSETRGDRRFYIAGGPHMKATAYRLMVSDLQRLMPLAAIVMALVLVIVTGSGRGVMIPMGTVLIATLWTFAAMAASGHSLNLLTVVLGPVLIAVGSVYGVHILAHYEAAASASQTSLEAARRVVESTRAPVLIAGASTMTGFAALLLTDTPAARELGLFATLGVAAVTLISLTGLPAFVALLPLREQTQSSSAAHIGGRLDDALCKLAGFTGRHARKIVLAWVGTALIALIYVPSIEMDTDYLSFFSSDSELRRHFAAVNELLAGAVPIYVTISSEGSGPFNQPENLEQLAAAQERFDALPTVTHSVSIPDLIRAVNKAVNEDDEAFDRIPESEAGVAELMFVIPKNKRRPLINIDQSRSNIPVRTGEQGSANVRRLVDGLQEIVDEELRPPLEVEITGDTVLLNRSADLLALNQTRTVGTTAVAIFVIVLFVFRSIPIALVAMVPNLVPVLLYYGALGAGLAPLSLPTSLIASIVLGIAVDDTAHFLTRYRNSRDLGMTPEEAVLDCGRHVGRPIVITSVMLFCGFLVVALSGFATLQEFGLLIGFTILICLATDLVLLPAVLVAAKIR